MNKCVCGKELTTTDTDGMCYSCRIGLQSGQSPYKEVAPLRQNFLEPMILTLDSNITGVAEVDIIIAISTVIEHFSGEGEVTSGDITAALEYAIRTMASREL